MYDALQKLKIQIYTLRKNIISLLPNYVLMLRARTRDGKKRMATNNETFNIYNRNGTRL